MTQRQRILLELPATTPELAAIIGSDVRHINAQLCELRTLGLVKRSDRRGQKQPGPGRYPHLWVRT